MANRHQLRKVDLTQFKKFLEDQNEMILPCKGEHEVLRWAGVKKRPMPIIFRQDNSGEFLTVGTGAQPYVTKFFRSVN